MDKNMIKKNAEKVIRCMKAGYQYTLTKLQELTTLANTELCFALLVLIQENRVQQYQSNDGVRYVLMP